MSPSLDHFAGAGTQIIARKWVCIILHERYRHLPPAHVLGNARSGDRVLSACPHSCLMWLEYDFTLRGASKEHHDREPLVTGGNMTNFAFAVIVLSRVWQCLSIPASDHPVKRIDDLLAWN